MDLSHVERFFLRNGDAVVAVFIEGDDDQPCYLGSGVLVRIGDREFVLTAAHNVWRKERDRLAQIAVGMGPNLVSALIHPGDGSTGRVLCPPAKPGEDPEPDVAVIELTDKTLLMRHRRPYGENEIGFFHPASVSHATATECAGCELVATGLPVGFLRPQAGLDLGEGRGTRLSLSVTMSSMSVYSIPSRADRPPFQKEPRAGRGFHVYFGRTMEAEDGTHTAWNPDGMSGGPVVVPEGDGMLVGLARGKMEYREGWDEWCEPAGEAVRLLIGHEDAKVAAAATRIVERYDAARSQAHI
jgi:hypothetical protein